MSTIDKALDILEVINNNDGEMGLVDLAQLIDCNVSTAYRICSVLLKRGYLQQKQKRGKYFLGYKFLQYSSRKNIVFRLKNVASSYMHALSNETSETINLSILAGEHATNIAIVTSESLLQVVSKEETTLPLHCTAAGKILLAHLAEEKRELMIASMVLKANTDRTITDVAQLKHEIEKIRTKGVAFDDEEYTLGIRSLAVPVRDDTENVIAALSLVGPSIRISEDKLLQLTPVLIKYAKYISNAFGGYAEDYINTNE